MATQCWDGLHELSPYSLFLIHEALSSIRRVLSRILVPTNPIRLVGTFVLCVHEEPNLEFGRRFRLWQMQESTSDGRARSIRYGLRWTRRLPDLCLLLYRLFFAILKTVTGCEAIVS